MPPLAKNIFAVILGLVVGSIVNMAIVQVGAILVPAPEGSDVTTIEGVKEAMKSFGPANFLVPFMAHALGTFVGAMVAARIAESHKMIFALGIGGFFLLGGMTMVAIVGGPLWFILLDLVVAYIPMAYVGGMLAGGRKTKTRPPAEKQSDAD